MYVVRVVELTVPTEKTYGPFPHAKAASDFIAECYRSDRAEREKWQSSQVLQLFPPGAVGPY